MMPQTLQNSTRTEVILWRFLKRGQLGVDHFDDDPLLGGVARRDGEGNPL